MTQMQTPNLFGLTDEQISHITDLWHRDCPADIICDWYEEQDLSPDDIMEVVQKHYYKN